jgi:hypothetical protein
MQSSDAKLLMWNRGQTHHGSIHTRPPPGSDVGIPGATRARRTQEGSSPGTAVQTTLISNSAPASSNGAPALNRAVL